MTSKIDNSPPVPPLQSGRAVSRADGDRVKPAEGVPASDSLKLSGEATQLASAKTAAAASPFPFLDKAKIDSLRMSLASGAYKINPQDIAARLLALERELGP